MSNISTLFTSVCVYCSFCCLLDVVFSSFLFLFMFLFVVVFVSLLFVGVIVFLYVVLVI